MLDTANIFVTGGAGTLGRAIARYRKQQGWKGKLTVYSTDTHKHELMRRDYPDVSYIQGDIRNDAALYNAMAGHDVVIHAAAVKVIPASEDWSIDTVDVNVFGSQNVCAAAVRAQVKHILGISTDKACHPANAYGATKMLMEKIFQEYARMGFDTQFHLVRYGNVLESTGSVIEAWKNSVARGEPIKITDPAMTRFWLSPMQAVQYVVDAVKFFSGLIYIPKMPALSIGQLAEYTVPEARSERVALRPGEKIHETLLTRDEMQFAVCMEDYFLLHPSTDPRYSENNFPPYCSDVARELTRNELTALLRNE